MMHRVLILFSVAVCAATILLDNGFGLSGSADACVRSRHARGHSFVVTQEAEAAPRCGEATTVGQATTTSFVCPIYCYAFHDTVCSYYSEHCDMMWVSLDAPCNKTGRCADANKVNCVDVGTHQTPPPKKKLLEKNLTLAKGGHGDHHVHKDVKKGLAKKGAPKPISAVIPGENAAFVSGLSAIVADLELNAPGTRKAQVALYQMLVNPAKIPGIMNPPPARIMTSGIEVENGFSEITLKYNDAVVSTEGDHVCTVQVGDVKYVVIMHKDTKIDAPPP
jgi:hypothetical protein